MSENQPVSLNLTAESLDSVRGVVSSISADGLSVTLRGPKEDAEAEKTRTESDRKNYNPLKSLFGINL